MTACSFFTLTKVFIKPPERSSEYRVDRKVHEVMAGIRHWFTQKIRKHFWESLVHASVRAGYQPVEDATHYLVGANVLACFLGQRDIP